MFCLQYVAQTYGKEAVNMVWLRPGSSNICTVLIYVNLLGAPDGWGLPYRVRQCLPETITENSKTVFLL